MAMVRTYGWIAVLAVAVVILPHVANAQQPEKEPADKKTDPLPTLKGTSVSIPWQELRQLLQRDKAAARVKPPVEFVFSPAQYAATVKGDKVSIDASVQVQTLTENWTLVPLGSASSGVLSVTVDGKPASIISRGNTLSVLLKGAGEKKITMKLEAKVSVMRGEYAFSLPLIPSPIVNVSAAIASTKLKVTAPGASALSVSENGNATKVTGTFRGESMARIQWKARPAVEKMQNARVYVDTNTVVTISSGLIRCSAQVRYDIQVAPVDAFRIHLPEGAQLLSAVGSTVKTGKVAMEDQKRVVIVELDAPVRGRYDLSLTYEVKPGAAGEKTLVPVIGHPASLQDHGNVGIEVRGSMEIVPTVAGAERVDVKELPGDMWRKASSPLLFAYRYTAPPTSVSVDINKHEDISVLVAMSDICEASTVVTEEGRAITKMMFIMRNNRKQYMELKVPAGAQIWSAFVDDRPVTPAKNKNGLVLIPLKKSETVDNDDEKSYRSRREQRRKEGPERLQRSQRVRELRKESDEPAKDLKPYDVEIVFIQDLKMAKGGELNLQLPSSDIPTGHVAWAVFLPKSIRVLDTEGPMKEVARFSLPFRHFGEAAYARRQKLEGQLAQAEALQDMAKEMAQQRAALAQSARAKGVLPVRVEMPIVGEIYRFEKFLVIDESPSAKILYRTIGS